MRNGVVVDMGGSGTRIGAVVGGHVVGVHTARVATAGDLAAAVLAVDPTPAGVGVSINGSVDATGAVSWPPAQRRGPRATSAPSWSPASTPRSP